MAHHQRTPSSQIPTVDGTDQLVELLHSKQVDKQNRPYIRHLRTVAWRLAPHGEYAYMAGLLHDVVEDTFMTIQGLREFNYPEIVVGAVDAVTRRDGESYLELIARACAHPLGVLVKFADNNTNLEDIEALPAAEASRLKGRYYPARERLAAAIEAGHGTQWPMFGPIMPQLTRPTADQPARPVA